MEGKSADLPAGGAGEVDLKSPAGPGGNEAGGDVTGLKSKISELLTENKSYKARLETFEANERKRAEDEAKKKGDYETIIKGKDEDLSRKDGLIKALKVENVASRMNFNDPSDVTALVGSLIKDDLSNVEEELQKLAESKPYLLKGNQSGQTQTPGTDKSKGIPNTPGHIFTRAEVAAISKDPAAWTANKAEIIRQQRQGLIKT